MVQPLSTAVNGQRFVPNSLLTEPQTTEVKRSWKERLFSWPWTPLKPTKYVTTQVASRQVIHANGVYYAHPDVIADIQRAFDMGKQ